eukprot:858961-Rhodomonas_salina.1
MAITRLPIMSHHHQIKQVAEWVRTVVEELAEEWVSSLVGTSHLIIAPTAEGATRGREDLG